MGVRTLRLVLASLLGVAAAGVVGCLGPEAVCQTRARYNEVIQATNNEELLLNLVRLRYLESAGFLPVTGLTAQFELDLGATYRNGIDRGPRYSNFGEGSLRFADRPTVTFAPQRSPELTKGLLSRIPLETFYLLHANDLDPNRLLRLLVRNLNGLDNAGSSGGPAHRDPPEFAQFRRAADLLSRLNVEHRVVLGSESREMDVPGAPTLPSLTTEELLKIRAAGQGVRTLGEGKGYALTQTKSVRVLRVQPGAAASPEMLELAHLLRLRPGQETYEVEEVLEGQFPPAEADGQRTRLTLTTRSILEVMYLLSQVVDVPPDHVCAGLVQVTRNPDGSPFDWGQVLGNLFRVQVGRHKPKGAYLAVKYRCCWFFIDDDDVASKVTLNVFNDLFRLQRLGAAEGQPLLTLPVGR